jgi:hypothetical protein
MARGISGSVTDVEVSVDAGPNDDVGIGDARPANETARRLSGVFAGVTQIGMPP